MTHLALLTLVPLMLASYGLCFGLMNDKAKWLTDRLRKLRIRVQNEEEADETTFFDRMFHCPYCTGFHTGWTTWLASLAVIGPTIPVGDTPEEIACGVGANIVCAVLFAFASSAFCYLVDVGAQWLEMSVR
jgi:hypothetical protein